jgi:hypothetical protein
MLEMMKCHIIIILAQVKDFVASMSISIANSSFHTRFFIVTVLMNVVVIGIGIAVLDIISLLFSFNLFNSHLYSTTAKTTQLSYPPPNSPLRGIKEIHVLNLKSAPNRLHEFMQRSGLTRDQFHLFEAIDIAELSTIHFNEVSTSHAAISHVFRGNIFGWDTMYIAEALSHYTMWQHIADWTTDEMHLVMEDGVEFASADWISKWNNEYYPDLPDDA